MISFFLELVYK